MNDAKMEFATVMAEYGSHGFLGMTECEKYGMTWGCDEDCPVYQRGECKNEVTLALFGDNTSNKGSYHETKPTEYMETKDLNLCEMLKGHEEEYFFSPVFGECKLRNIYKDNNNGCQPLINVMLADGDTRNIASTGHLSWNIR